MSLGWRRLYPRFVFSFNSTFFQSQYSHFEWAVNFYAIKDNRQYAFVEHRDEITKARGISHCCVWLLLLLLILHSNHVPSNNKWHSFGEIYLKYFENTKLDANLSQSLSTMWIPCAVFVSFCCGVDSQVKRSLCKMNSKAKRLRCNIDKRRTIVDNNIIVCVSWLYFPITEFMYCTHANTLTHCAFHLNFHFIWLGVASAHSAIPHGINRLKLSYKTIHDVAWRNGGWRWKWPTHIHINSK